MCMACARLAVDSVIFVNGVMISLSASVSLVNTQSRRVGGTSMLALSLFLSSIFPLNPRRIFLSPHETDKTLGWDRLYWLLVTGAYRIVSCGTFVH